jgi:hypothetical protein
MGTLLLLTPLLGLGRDAGASGHCVPTLGENMEQEKHLAAESQSTAGADFCLTGLFVPARDG